MGSKKGNKSTKAEAEAGARNLQNWLDKNPAHGHLTHGAYSGTVRKRYSDGRTTEGKKLAAIVDGYADELGGAGVLTSSQRTRLAFVRTKIIVIFQITDFVDRQEFIVNPQGQLLPCLNLLATYCDSVERTLDKLFPDRKKQPKIPSIADIIEANDNEHS